MIHKKIIKILKRQQIKKNYKYNNGDAYDTKHNNYKRIAQTDCIIDTLQINVIDLISHV